MHDDDDNSPRDSSPIPKRAIFPAEDEDQDVVQALAAKLAPDLEQTDAILSTTLSTEFAAGTGSVYDDDGMGQEERSLVAAEEALRRELALIGMASSSQDEDSHSDAPWYNEAPWWSQPTLPAAEQDKSNSNNNNKEIKVAEEPKTPVRKQPKLVAPTPPSTTSTVHSSGYWVGSGDQFTPTAATPTKYRHEDHMQVLNMSKDPHYVVNLTGHVASASPQSTMPMIQEYLVTPSAYILGGVFAGFQKETSVVHTSSTSAPADNAADDPEQHSAPPKDTKRSETPKTWPVRTITIRIRPDVLCGAVMDALSTRLMDRGAEIEKRQGGHLQALWLTGLKLDIQLVTQKAQLERQLLIRFFYTDAALDLKAPTPPPSPDKADIQTLIENGLYMGEDEHEDAHVLISSQDRASFHLRECAALVQRMETPMANRKAIRLTSNPLTQRSMQKAVSEHLQDHYIPCPSARDGGITLPALNDNDFQLLQKTWPLVADIWEELETRDLIYSSLLEQSFGAFPALKTLDVQYCAQLRRISRELMVAQLLSSANALEEFAREAEYACANVIALLQHAFTTYGIPEPPLPEPVPLSQYPLDYVPPQVACPPWGLTVQSALTQIQTWQADDGPEESSMERADRAVNLILQALQKQDDEEKAVRLERKNRQVMDRLAAMQKHEKTMVDALRTSDKAVAAAADFARQTGVSPQQVPLLTWSLVAGGAGTCTVTSHYMMIATRRIPIIGGTHIDLFELRKVEFEVVEDDKTTSSLLLNPLLPTQIRITDRVTGEERMRFRPSMAGSRLVSFLERLQTNPLLD